MRARYLLGLAFFAALVSACASEPSPPQSGSFVVTTSLDGAITPVTASHLRDGIEFAERSGADAYVIQLDTPGGLDTSMRSIVQDMYAAEIPVIVYIAPAGARGGSAGAIITFAANIAAMAPGTAIGAATPVDGASGDDVDTKIINDAAAFAQSIADFRGRPSEFIVETVTEGRSVSALEALELGAIDIMAADLDELLDKVDGMNVNVGTAQRSVVLQTAGSTLLEQPMGIFRSIQQVLATPTIAFLLLSIGTLGLIYELASPGIGVGAVLGVVFIALGLFGLALVSVNLVGVVFLLIAMALFVAELLAPGIGVAAAGGVGALALAGIFLFDDASGFGVSLAVVLPTAIVVGVFVVIAGRLAVRARLAPSTIVGEGALIGSEATIRRVAEGAPQIFAAGAWWSVRSGTGGTALSAGDRVRVVAAEGLFLDVERLEIDTTPQSSAHFEEDSS